MVVFYRSPSSKIAMLNADYQFQKKENQLNVELKGENRQKRWLLIEFIFKISEVNGLVKNSFFYHKLTK